MSKAISYTLFALVILSALALRIWGTGFGLPHIYHPDEPHEVYRALRLGAGSFDFSAYRALKGGYFYILFLEYAIFFTILSITGAVHGAADFAMRFALDPSEIWIIGRLTTAVMGTGTVVLLFFLGEKAYRDRRIGFMAAVLLAFSFRHIFDSHFITVDVPMTFVLVAGFMFLLKITGKGTLRDYLASALLLSFAVQFKIVAGAAFFAFASAHLLGTLRNRDTAKERWKRFGFSFFAAVLFYLAGNPGIVVNAGEILSYFTGSFSGGSAPSGFATTMSHRDYLGIRFYARSYTESSGIVITALTAAGLILGAVRRRRSDIILLSFILPLGVVLVFSQTVAAPRYLIPILPFLYLLASVSLIELWKKIPEMTRMSAAIRGAMLLLVTLSVVPPVQRAIKNDLQYSMPDTRTNARKWITANIPAGSRIAISGDDFFPSSGTVAIPISAEYMREKVENVTDSGKKLFLENYKIPAISGDAGYVPVYFDLSQENVDLNRVWDLEPEYAVISSANYRKFLTEKGRINLPEFSLFFERIMDEELIQVIVPVDDFVAGPTISIYKLDRHTGNALKDFAGEKDLKNTCRKYPESEPTA